jgi:hypothetical protein
MSLLLPPRQSRGASLEADELILAGRESHVSTMWMICNSDLARMHQHSLPFRAEVLNPRVT